MTKTDLIEKIENIGNRLDSLLVDSSVCELVKDIKDTIDKVNDVLSEIDSDLNVVPEDDNE